MLTHTSDQRADPNSPMLVLTDPLQAHREVACTDLLCVGDPDAALVVTHRCSPHAVADRLASMDALTVLSQQRGTVESLPVPEHVTVSQCPVENLTQLGVAVNEAIDRHDGSMSVCLGSVTAMLQYVDADTACQFLAAVLEKLTATDAVVHAHLDPDAVPSETATSVTACFDAVMEHGDDGWSVETA